MRKVQKLSLNPIRRDISRLSPKKGANPSVARSIASLVDAFPPSDLASSIPFTGVRGLGNHRIGYLCNALIPTAFPKIRQQCKPLSFNGIGCAVFIVCEA
jgi:hypothetical protein